MGYSKNARHGVPWRLVYVESFATRAEAVNKERLHKTGNGSDELQALLAYRVAAAMCRCQWIPAIP
jgi:predicted GIY-YIG superfamily endonuclease